MDRRAWWATVHGIAESWTWLSTHTYLYLLFYMSLMSQLFYTYFTSSLVVFASLHFVVVVETSIFPSLPPTLVLKWWSLHSLRTVPDLQIESVLCRNTCGGKDWFRGAQLIHDHLDHVALKKIRWMEQGTLVRWSAHSTRLRAAGGFLLLHQFIIKWLMHLGALGFMKTRREKCFSWADLSLKWEKGMWSTKGLARTTWIINSLGSQKPNFSPEQEANVATLGSWLASFVSLMDSGWCISRERARMGEAGLLSSWLKLCLFLKGGALAFHHWFMFVGCPLCVRHDDEGGKAENSILERTLITQSRL